VGPRTGLDGCEKSRPHPNGIRSLTVKPSDSGIAQSVQRVAVPTELSRAPATKRLHDEVFVKITLLRCPPPPPFSVGDDFFFHSEPSKYIGGVFAMLY